MRTKRAASAKKQSNRGTKSTRAPQLRTLPAAELRRLVRPHPGYEEFVEPFAQIMSQFVSDIAPNGIDVEGMRASVRKYQDLASTREATAQRLALIDSTRFVESSNAYRQLLLIYGRAREAARTNPDIALAIRSFEQFMKHGPRSKPAATTPAVTTPTAPTV